jgi:hypothetical protein
MGPQRKNLNYLVLMIFAPVLILVGIAGFIMPTQLSSNAPAYNIFHIFFGVVGLAFVLMKNGQLIRAFNIGFGAIDLYQAAASFLHLFPESYFRWTTGDDILHILIGAALVLVGLCARTSQQQADSNAA